MERLTQSQLDNKNEIISDKSLSLDERKIAYKEVMDQTLNPNELFNPQTFDPMSEDPDYEVKKRLRVKHIGKLETMGMNPKKQLEGQMVGMFESKQDLYLLFANKINDLIDRVDELERKLPNK